MRRLVQWSLLLTVMALHPNVSWAKRDPGDDPPPSGGTDYLSQLKKVYGFKMDDLAGVSWTFPLLMTLATITCLGAFLYLLWAVVDRVLQAQQGKVTLFEGNFWKRIGVSFFLLFALMAGLYLTFAERLFDLFNSIHV